MSGNIKAVESLNIDLAMTSPTSINKIHESCYRASATLKIVLIMLGRKDSHETIIDIINAVYGFPQREETM